MSEIVVHRTDGEGLPVRTRRGLVEPIDARVTRLLALALPADAGPVSEVGFTAQLGAMAAASKAALAADLTCYLAWCDDTRVAPLPADPEGLVRYRGGSVHLNSSARLLSGASAGFMPLRETAG